MNDIRHYLFIAAALCGRYSDGTPVPARHPSIPANWKDLLTPEVYNYHLNKGHASHAFEGDIAGIDKQTDNHETEYLLRNAIVDKNMRWTNGLVPYQISASFTPHEHEIIEEALQDMMKKTCVRFVPYVAHPDYISFVRRGMGCSSYVARTGGKQLVDLQPGCIYQIGEVQHEVMHALGFFHEQSRTDRDDYVTIIWSNVINGTEDQFQTYRSDNLNMPYDYESIMHYGWNYFAIDTSKPTILPKVKAALGTRTVMSPSDVEKINRLYECPHVTSVTTTVRPAITTRHGSPIITAAKTPSSTKMATTKPTTTTRKIPTTTMRAVISTKTTTRSPSTTLSTRRTTTASTTTTTEATFHSAWYNFKHAVKDLIREEFS